MPDETPTTPEDPAGDETPPEAPKGRVVPAWIAALLAIALVASLIAVVLLWLDRSDQRDQVAELKQTAAAEKAAEEAAVNAMVRMTTYSHRTVDEDYAWVDEVGTAEFEKTWTPARKSAVRLIKSVKARAKGDVINSAAEAVGDSEVRVLLFTDQQLFQQGTKKSDLEETRVEMTMVEQDDRWLVDSIEVQNFFAGDPTSPDQGSQ